MATRNRFTTTEPMTGYKIVSGNGEAVMGDPVVYVVGKRYELAATDTLAICDSGYHFCPLAIDCLASVSWEADRRLFTVAVPAGTEVETDGTGKFAARTLDVVADVTSDVPILLTGVRRGVWNDCQQTACYRNGLRHGEPACVTRSDTDVWKSWYCDGELQGAIWKLWWRRRGSLEAVYWEPDGQNITPSHPDWQWLRELATKAESFE
jgi:hypothetical protein